MLVLLVSVKGTTVYGRTPWHDVDAVTQSRNSIKLSWKKKSVTQYRIYRASVKTNGKPGKFKKIATISGKKKSYTDKVSYKKYYEYRVDGYKKKGKKYIKKCSGKVPAKSWVADVVWGDYMPQEAKVTPKSISFDAYYSLGLEPTGCEIYRSTDGKKYKKLNVVKRKKISPGIIIEYVDKKVNKGQSYYYKLRSYRILKGKKYYGKYTSPLRMTAVNEVGQYKLRVLTPESPAVSELTVCVTSDEDNADLNITVKSVNRAVLGGFEEKDGSLFYLKEDLILSKYSYDNKTWHQAGREDIVVKPKQSIYLQFVSKKGGDFAYQVSDKQSAELTLSDVEYNNFCSLFTICPNENMAQAYLDGEKY